MTELEAWECTVCGVPLIRRATKQGDDFTPIETHSSHDLVPAPRQEPRDEPQHDDD